MAERTYTWTDAEPYDRLADIMAKAKEGDVITETRRYGSTTRIAFTLTTDEPWWKDCQIVMINESLPAVRRPSGEWELPGDETRYEADGLNNVTPLVTAEGRRYVTRDVRQRLALRVRDKLALTEEQYDVFLALLDNSFGIDGEPD